MKILAGAAVVVAALLGGSGCSQEPPGRFVVLVVMDTVRRDALGCYGNPLATTPNIDALERESVRFDQAVSTSGWTLPAVASLLTATWPSIHGGLGRGDRITPVRSEVATAAEVMKRAGYQTAAYVNGAFLSPALGVDRGFDVYDHTDGAAERRADATVDAAIEYARSNRSQSCFLMVHFNDAHLDYDPPGEFRTRFTGGRTQPAPPLTMDVCLGMQRDGSTPRPVDDDVSYVRGVYLGEVSFVDANVGRLVAELKTLGLYERAVIVVTADHGEEFWEHGGFAHGHTLYDELIRVPMIIKFPYDVHPVMRRVSWQVRTIDAIPTVLDYLGIDAPPTFEGESLLEFVRGEPRGHRPAFVEGVRHGSPRIGWRMSGYTHLQGVDGDPSGELFDWSDAGEQRDLTEAYPDEARRMRVECTSFYSGLLERVRTMSTSAPIDVAPEAAAVIDSVGNSR